MRFARMLPRVALGAFALLGASLVGAQTPSSVSLSSVYGITYPDTVPDPMNGVNAFQQTRAFAVNNNPGSPWQGTLYMTLRFGATGAAQAPANILYWKPTSTHDPSRGSLKVAGPDLANADGHFVPPAGFTAHSNAWWAIAIADDDMVYATSLNSGDIYRFNPDLTEPVKMTPNVGTDFIRTLEAYGKGINTEIWYNIGAAKGDIIRMKASAVDGQNRPTAFTRTLSIPLALGGNAHLQGAPNNARDAYYMAFFPKAGEKQGPAKIAMPSGIRNTAFPSFEVASGTGLQIDSMDRVIYTIGYAGTTTNELYALDPVTGANLTNPTNFLPQGLVKTPSLYGNHLLLARYSDRHYFVMAVGVATAASRNVLGVVATDVPAPSPKNIRARNMGVGDTLQLSWTPANDPEVTGVFLYRSESAGSLGTALNSTPLTATTYTDAGLTAGKTYYYTLKSQGLDPFTGATYDGVESAQIHGTPTVLQAPNAPTGVTVTDTTEGSELLVRWTTPAADTEVINVYRSETAGSLGTLVKEAFEPAAGAQGSFLDTGLVNGTTYYYTVRAGNVIGESNNTNQVSGKPTDIVPPTFAGAKAIVDYGFPGVRVSWDNAVDKSGPITYAIYTAPSLAQMNYSTPRAIVTGQTFYDVKGLPLGQDSAIVVRARDSAGNEDANTKSLLVLPNRVIVDPDMSGGANRDKFNPQPDPAFPALGPEGVGSSKGNAPDLVPVTFNPGGYFFQTNDKKAKSSYELNIPVAGNYDISAWWTSNANLDAPNYTFRITYPNGATEDVVKDMKGGSGEGANGSRWNLLVENKFLTPGTLTIIGDATTITNDDETKINVSSAIRALLNVVPKVVPIYTATSPITVDGNVTDAEWAGANSIVLGRSFQDVIGGNWTGPNDYSANVRLKWDAQGLYVAGQVTDDVLSFKEGAPTASYSFWDSLEVFLGMDPEANPARTTYAAAGDYQVLLTGYRDSSTLKGIMAEGGNRLDFDPEFGDQQAAFAQTANGYNFEAFVPWNAMAADGIFPPEMNQIIGFNLQGIDNDTVTELSQQSAFSLSGKGQSFQNPQNWVKAQLLGAPPARPRGDIDLDGVFTANDARVAMRVAGGLLSVSSEARAAGDVNGDGKITMEDVVLMQRALANGTTP